MRLQVLSDLHLEFHADGGRAFVAGLEPSRADALVLAGDVCNAATMRGALRLICERYAPRPVYWVHGNHEFYGSDRRRVLAGSSALAEALPNLVHLDCGIADLGGGRRLLGAPLWFPESPSAFLLAREWSDFRAIRDFSKWVYRENGRACAFLRCELAPGDIVATHYLPARQSIGRGYAHAPTNCYFLCDLEPLIRERAPALWIHGHTHDSFDYAIGPTRIVCNPLGYVGHETNTAFTAGLVVEV